MIKILVNLLVVIFLSINFISSFVFAADEAFDQEIPWSGCQRRQAILDQIKPHLQNPSVVLPTFGSLVLTYTSNACVDEMLHLIDASINTDVESDQNAQINYIEQSEQLRTGTYSVTQCEPEHMISTGNLCECVAIVFQHEGLGLVAMYHYFQGQDENFEKFHLFFNDVKKILDAHMIDADKTTVSLVSSYLSADMIIIHNFLKKSGFVVGIYSNKRVYLCQSSYVNGTHGLLGNVGKLVIATPSLLKIYDHIWSKGNYDAESCKSDDQCSVM